MIIRDYSTVKRIHLVGIKGIAMAAFAIWAKESGMLVTGSDVSESFPSDPLLKAHGIAVNDGFDSAHISESHKPDLVVYTGAHKGSSNVEVERAVKLSIPVLSHGKALGIAMNTKKQISVAGSHGKTTTSAMIAAVLLKSNMDPSYAIGSGEIRGLGHPGHCGNGEYFVAEADEYVTDPQHDQTPRFLWQNPDILVVTNIDFDHPDVYKDLQAVQDAFIAFQKQLKGKKLTILNADNPESEVLKSAGSKDSIITYGQSEGADYRIDSIQYGEGVTRFSLVYKSKTLGQIELQVPGLHNILNATAAIVAGVILGVSWSDIVQGLASFGGARRRFELLLESKGITYFDDYAHHPKEIQATLQAVRAWYPNRRILAIFQPHTYSRTMSLLSDFGTSFSDASIVCLADIYASAREKKSLGISTQTLIEEVKKHHKHVVYTPQKNDIVSYLNTHKKVGDIVLFMGAGDIFSWEPDIIQSVNI